MYILFLEIETDKIKNTNAPSNAVRYAEFRLPRDIGRDLIERPMMQKEKGKRAKT